MNKIEYSLTRSIALLLLLFIAIPSCIFDNYPEEEGQGIIVVSLDGVTTRAAGDPLFTDDAVIHKVRVFVFIGDYLEKNVLFISGETEFINPFVLEVVTGDKQVYVVANETASLTNTLASITTRSKLMEVMADEISAPLTVPLVMTGSKGEVMVEKVEDQPRNTADITLTRLAAKINLNFKKETEAEVKITKVSLLSNTRKTLIWDSGATISDQTYWEHAIDRSTTPIELTSTETSLDAIYVYENLTGGSKDKATRLEMEALYNNIPTTYRVYVNENVSSVVNAGDPTSSVTTPADHLYSIKRNHAYQITGTITNIGEFDGLTLTTQVLPWNHLSSTVTFDHIYTIDPQPIPDEKTYTVGTDGTVTFTFTLTNPIDASWVANLTNPTDFEFVGAYQGATDETVNITIKAKNTAGEQARETEFYINVGFGGNWTEVPLLSGTKLVGENNRIVINQPAATNP